MSSVIASLYLLASALMFYNLYTRITSSHLLVAGLALLAALEEQHWFLTVLWGDAALDWPARNLTDIFAVAWAGADSSVTLVQLGIIGFGRLVVALIILYIGIYIIRSGITPLRTLIDRISLPTLALIGLWAACMILTVSIQIFAPGLLPRIEYTTRLMGAVACLAYTIRESLPASLRAAIHWPRVSIWAWLMRPATSPKPQQHKS